MPGGIGEAATADVDADGCPDLWLGALTESAAFVVRGPRGP